MRRMILATHGSLAEGMKSAAVMILGDSCRADAFGLDTWGTPQAILTEVQKLIAKAPDDEYIILCDIKGGSVCNRMIELTTMPNVTVISGLNLSLVLSLALMPEKQRLSEVLPDIIAEAQKGIQFFDASVMKKLKEKEEDDEIW